MHIAWLHIMNITRLHYKSIETGANECTVLNRLPTLCQPAVRLLMLHFLYTSADIYHFSHTPTPLFFTSCFFSNTSTSASYLHHTASPLPSHPLYYISYSLLPPAPHSSHSPYRSLPLTNSPPPFPLSLHLFADPLLPHHHYYLCSQEKIDWLI